MAISYIASSHANNAGTPPTLTAGASIPAGSLIVVIMAGNVSAATITDNVNSGSYTVVGTYSNPTAAIFYKVANATGTPSITIGNTSSNYITADISAYTGFTGTPTLDPHYTAETFSGTSATLTGSPITTNYSNELLVIGTEYPTTFGTGTATGWTALQGNWNNGGAGYAILPTSGTTNNFSATINASEPWKLNLAGFYDAGAAGYTLTAANGSYAMTGEAATLTSATVGFSLSAAAGTYSYLGAQGFSAYQVDAAYGAFTETGEAATLSAGTGPNNVLTAGYGTYAIAGQNTGASPYILQASGGVYSYTAPGAILIYAGIGLVGAQNPNYVLWI